MESNTQKPLSEATGKIILIIILFWSHLGFSQNANHAFYVQFNDKDTNFNINEILSPKAIERRNKYQIQLNYSDYPVKKNYLQKLNQLDSITVRYALKWSNSAIIESSTTYVSTRDSLPFIS